MRVNHALTGILLILSVAVPAASEQHKGMSFQAVLRDPEGRYPTASGVTATLQILDPVSNCVLREEEHSGVNISNGYLNLAIGSSSATTPLNSNPSPLLSMREVMDNSKPINGFNCVYNPSAHHGRKLRLSVKVPRSSGGQIDDVIADFNMRAVAYAVNSETLNGKSDSQFINVNDSKNLTQMNIESIFQRFTKLDALLNNANSSGTSLGVNITGNAATATSVSGTVGIANGGTGATTADAARTNLGLGTLATLSPTGTADNTTYLRGDGTWATASGGGGGTITQVTAGTGLSGGGSSGAVSVSVNYGTAAGTAAEGNDSRITGAFQSSTNLTGGDLSGTLPGPTVSRINGVNVSTAVAGDDQKFLKFVNGSGWQPHFVKLSELKNNLGTASVFNVAACTSSQTMAWSSLTDQFSCQDITLPVAKVTGLATSATTDATNATNITSGTLDVARLPSSVTNGLWMESGGSVYRNAGNVGVGTTSPSTLFHLNSGVNPAFRLVDGTQGAGKVLTSDTNGNATWVTPMGGFAPDSQDNLKAGNNVMSGTPGWNNLAMGNSALKAHTSGDSNIALGPDALTSLATGSNNIALGINAAKMMNIANDNIALGAQSLGSISSGEGNIALGLRSGFLLSGSDNVSVGRYAGGSLGASSQNNVMIGANTGYQSGYAAPSSNKVMIGANAKTSSGSVNLSNSFITLIGANTSANLSNGVLNGDAYSTAIGAGSTVTTTNTVVLGRASDKVVIGSTADNGSSSSLQVTGGAYISGNVGIGTSTPNYPLDISQSTTSTSGVRAAIKSSQTLAPASSTDAVYYGLSQTIDTSGTASFNDASVFGVSSQLQHQTASNLSSMRGLSTVALNGNTGTIVTLYGVDANARNTAGGNVTLQNGVRAVASNLGSGLVNTGVGVYSSVNNSGAGEITTAKAGNFLVLRSAGTITDGYGVYVGSVQATNPYSIYASDVTAPSYFAGNVGIGVTNPGQKLTVAGTIESTSGGIKFPDGTTQTTASTATFRTSCPAGFTLIGTSGSAEAFCISTNEESANTWLGSATDCYNKTPTKARLCSASEWVMACVSGLPVGMTGNWEWVADLYNIHGQVMGYGGCDSSNNTAGVGYPNVARCCFR